MNSLTTLYKTLQHAHFARYSLIVNPNITLEFVKNDKHLCEIIIEYSYNPNITIDEYFEYIFEKSPSFNSNLKKLLKPQDAIKYHEQLSSLVVFESLEWVTIEFVLANPQFCWDYNVLMLHPNFTWDIICANPQLPWKKELFVYNINFTHDIYVNNLDIFKGVNTHLDYISEHPEKPWNWNAISSRDDLDLNFILANSDKIIDWKMATTSSKITLKDIINNPHLPWRISHTHFRSDITFEFAKDPKNFEYMNWHGLSSHKNISLDDIENNLDCPWDWEEICNRYDIDMDFVIRNIDYTYLCFNQISANPAITLEDRIKYPYYPWSYDALSINPNLTAKYVLENLHRKWNFFKMSNNLFCQHEYFRSDLYRQKQCRIRSRLIPQKD